MVPGHICSHVILVNHIMLNVHLCIFFLFSFSFLYVSHSNSIPLCLGIVY